MNKQMATIGIIVKNYTQIPEINMALHRFSDCIISRLGMPYPERNVRLIHVLVDTYPEDVERLVEELNAILGVEAQAMFF